MAPGVVLIDKPESVSSFAALGRVKRMLQTRKVGHTGTLDPFATGLMVALVGSATKAAPLFSGLTKRYRAVFSFGTETDTLDPTGEPTRNASPPSIDALREACGQWIGAVEQIPPEYSAVHIDGKRSYELARSGTPVTPKPRSVEITELTLLDYTDGEATVEVACSAGTYIRALARDIGRMVGSAAHVKELRRTTVGPFSVEEAVSSDRYDGQLLRLTNALVRLDSVTAVAVSPALAARVAHGGSIERDIDLAGVQASELLLHVDGAAVALVRRENGTLRYRAVLGAASTGAQESGAQESGV